MVCSFALIRYCDENRRRWFSRSSPKAAIGFWDCEVSSNADFSQPLGVVEKSRGAEYPPSPTKKKALAIASAFFSYIRLAASDIALRAVLEANIISLLRSRNITFCVSKIYHSDEVGISLKFNSRWIQTIKTISHLFNTHFYAIIKQRR